MATINVTLDSRKPKLDGSCPLKLTLAHNSQVAYIHLGISLLPSQWNEESKSVVNHPRKTIINTTIKRKLIDLEHGLVQVTDKLGRDARIYSARQLRDILLQYLDNGSVELHSHIIESWFGETLQSRKTYNTSKIYNSMWRRVKGYVGEEEAHNLTFEQIDTNWLEGFIDNLHDSGLKRTTILGYLSKLQVLFHKAIDAKAISHNPFKGISVKADPTRKRSLPIEVVARIMQATLKNKRQELARDVFKLSFYLIGINIHDIYMLQKSDLIEDRIYYKRAKTGRTYDIKVYREAMDLILKYQDESDSPFLLDFHKRNPRLESFSSRINRGLESLSKYLGLPIKITTYWARHSWATLASHIDIPKETISRALGHAQLGVTEVYIDYDMRKIDEANARVIAVVSSQMMLNELQETKEVTLDDCPY